MAAVATFILGVVSLVPPLVSISDLAGGVALFVATAITGLVISRFGLPAALDVIPPLLFVAGVAMLRAAGGGHESELIPVFALPLIWTALYGTGLQMTVVLLACVAATIVPLVLIGPPAYPLGEARALLTNTAVGGVVVYTVQRLVNEVWAQRRAEADRAATLASREASLRATFATAQDAIVSLTLGGVIVDANPAAQEMFHGTREQLVGLDLISGLATRDEQPFLREGMERLAADRDGSVPRRFTTELIRLDGASFPAEVSVGVVLAGGKPVVHAFARDISERRRAEAAARQHADDMADLLEIGRLIPTVTRSGNLRATICRTAQSMTDAKIAFILEPSGGSLTVTKSTSPTEPAVRTLDLSQASLAGLAYRTGEPFFAGDLANDRRAAHDIAAQVGSGAGYWQPLLGANGPIGVLAVCWREPVAALDPRFESVLRLLGTQAQAALQTLVLVERLDDLARTDQLTGAANRRAFDEILDNEIERAARSGEPLSLAMLDLDFFKRYNDANGHQAGDSLLADAAAAWKRQLRASDVLARYGGEEFALILPNCDASSALQIVERVRAVTPGAQTVSAGVATRLDGELGPPLVGRADAALYAAKEAGRARAVQAVGA